LSFLLFGHVKAEPFVINSELEYVNISDQLKVLEDPDCRYHIGEIERMSGFEESDGLVNKGVSKSCFWFELQLTNESYINHFQLVIDHPILDLVEFYHDGQLLDRITEKESFDRRKYYDPNFILDVYLNRGETRTYYLKVYGSELVVMPISLGKRESVLNVSTLKEMLSGLYIGIILVMFLYNLFVYFTVRDISYLYYVVYILLIGLTQASLKGFTMKYLWPDSTFMNHYGVTLISSLVGISAVEFMKVFLHSKENDPLMHKLSYVINGIFIVSIVLCFAKDIQSSFSLMQLGTLVGTFYAMTLAIRILRKGYRAAKFFLIAWSILLVGAVIFVLKDFQVIPFNLYTNYSLQAASILEVVLLSFALADKINIMRREKEQSQMDTLNALAENERIVREQNVILEAKVEERTKELKVANDDLNTALVNLKEAQSQLVSAEKMASLGQLTAGIAHEINNPINFVSSSVKPLKENMAELTDLLKMYDDKLGESGNKEAIELLEKFKQQISYNYLLEETNEIIDNIGEGASRTAEIVLGLRTFSHVDDIGIKKVNVNDGIISTLKLLKGEIPKNLEVDLQLGELSELECYGGKINQVFMNVLNNAIQAVKLKGEEDGTITIITQDLKEGVKVTIEDNGVGMDEETREKMFEPFFTTKDVGEGTGLGLSVVYGIIESHHGTVDVMSELGKGTVFVINLPYIQPN
jgi:signal transduction histidine kinase